ncbi:sulfotransferase [Halieaceae bacterium IMCC14734]|uniref:Sulfotransferase n=1 Tax=Candidatus Litorirhabdus singularis TaxID=2518993 RepID=A0ABT3TH79_9GAMM|nr:sulfotransferase domain-containing protein [Candidatus Litorirhabdus singularis]MCX2981648.1 sulfotransferase [Candidatus Litorirhabdus singularis]
MSLITNTSIKLERWFRGRREFAQLQACDSAVVSYGKAGRTWLRVMISRYCQLQYGIADDQMLEFDNFHRLNPAAPKIFFSHDNYLRSYTGNLQSKRDYYRKPTLLLARRPQDVAVSQYFQWRHRMRPRKKVINGYPPHGAELSILEFVLHQGQGLPNIIRYMNLWAQDIDNMDAFAMVRYEDLRASPEQHMARVVEFLGLEFKPEWISECVQFASLENLRAKEKTNHFKNSGSRMQAGDPDNPDSFKVRRAKVGGYRDYFSDEEVATLDQMVEEQLKSVFGYQNQQ